MRESDDEEPERPRVGERFRPYKRFRNLLIPEAMARNRGLPPGAKLVYGRLCRYAGEDGRCFPSVASLAEEVGLGPRQVQNHLALLRREGFLLAEERFKETRGQTSNSYVFLWHRTFDKWEDHLNQQCRVNSSSPSPLHHNSTHPANRVSPKESHLKEGHSQEGAVRVSLVSLGDLDRDYADEE